MMFRAFGGMFLIFVGAILNTVGRMGLAGSGVMLDPEQAREDVKPWSQMAGGVANDALEEIEVIHKLADGFAAANGPRDRDTAVASIKIRCRKCQALNDETARFCDQCGAAI
jgi:hypothetical protein